MFGTVDVPVKLYSAVQDRSIHFRLLASKGKKPVAQHMIDPETDEVVEKEEVQKAYQTDDGELVILDDEELEEAAPKPSRDIEITRFVPPAKLTHQWYERPYWLGPDEKGESKYFTLAAALKRKDRVGVARWVMRNKEYVGALREQDGYLMLISLRHAAEVIPASALTPPSGRELAAKEVTMAKQLVAALEGELDMSEFKDEYRDRVLDFVEAKARGKVIRFPKAPARKTDESLTAALERSLAHTSKAKKSA